MKVLKFNRTVIALGAALALAACSSTPSNNSTTDQQAAQQPAPVTSPAPAPVEQAPVQQPVQQTQQPAQASVSADDFWNDASNYDGTTNTRNIYFSFDASTVPSASFATLKAHADYLKAHKNAKLRLEGNTDERGTREYNLALGQRRANAVEKFLRVQGVPASQIVTVSYGKEKPAELGHDPMSWAKNRRVFLDYLAGQP